jgi:hypothetical protein
MTSCATDQKEFIKTFYASGGSCVAVEIQCRREFSAPVAPSRDIIYWILNPLKPSG